MTYLESLEYITGLAPRGWRLGLDRMNEFCSRLGLNSVIDGSKIKYFHVAGTNGKGSTTAFLQNLLYFSGEKTGAFFSPYVVNPRERVQIGRDLISEDAFANVASAIQEIAESMSETEFGGITEFEFKTAMGFSAWQRAGCTHVALETGLGGRLDATNVVTPAASAIVSIGLDHQNILGNTLAEIAGEKAGIIKEGKPVVLGSMSEEASRVIHDVARNRDSEVFTYGKEFTFENGGFQSEWGNFDTCRPLLLQGARQEHNFAVALATLLSSGFPLRQEAVIQAAAQTFIPGRYQKVKYGDLQLILDGGHNPDSADTLVSTFQSDLEMEGKRAIIVTNMVQGHEPAVFYQKLGAIAEEFIVPPIDFFRARDPDETTKLIADLGLPAQSALTLPRALELAFSIAKSKKLPIIVTGSFYLVGEVSRLLKL